MKSIAISLSFIHAINAHSWARCVNYHAEITGLDYDEAECSGWIRGWTFDGVTFGQDRGINYQVGLGGGQALCQRTLEGTSDNEYGYANSDKVAEYVAGTTVRVVWPAKNHANYECMNNIPDTSMKLFYNPNVNPTEDLANNAGSMEGQGYELVKDWQDDCTAGSDDCGFQNCRRYCENTDGATCFGDFTVPDVDTPGYYTFVWYWIFNPGSPYISCWEAYIEPASNTGDDVVTETEFAESGGASTAGVLNGFITQAPICVTHDDTYDRTTLDAFVEQQLSGAMAEGDELEIVSKESDDTSYNFTIQISHASGGSELSYVLWDGTKSGDLRDDNFCDDFENDYPGTTCDNCLDVVTYALYKSGVDGMRVGSMLVVLFGFILAFF